MGAVSWVPVASSACCGLQHVRGRRRTAARAAGVSPNPWPGELIGSEPTLYGAPARACRDPLGTRSLERPLNLGIPKSPAPRAARSLKCPTGVPNKNYRGPQQGSCSAVRPLLLVLRANKLKTHLLRPPCSPPAMYRGAQQGLPGCPTSATGVPNKNYRGARQKLPGCPTSTTGVPDKNYRGAQQVALFKIAAK